MRAQGKAQLPFSCLSSLTSVQIQIGPCKPKPHPQPRVAPFTSDQETPFLNFLPATLLPGFTQHSSIQNVAF